MKTKNVIIISIISVILTILVITAIGIDLTKTFTTLALPETPTIDKDITDMNIIYENVIAIKLGITTTCYDVSKTGCNKNYDVLLNNKIIGTISDIPSCSSIGITGYNTEFRKDITGSKLLEGKNVKLSGGCSPASITSAKIIERTQCNTDNDCSFTQESNYIRTSTGKCNTQTHKCDYGIITSTETTLDTESLKNDLKENTKTKIAFFIILSAILIIILYIILKIIFGG